MSPLRGFPVISPLSDMSIHDANIHVLHCNGVMKWLSETGGVSPGGATCPCPRRRRESEVLVGCFAASVSEVSLAFCCVRRLKQSQRDKLRHIGHALTQASHDCGCNVINHVQVVTQTQKLEEL